MKTYSTSNGTSLESSSKSTLIDVLGLIPDNSNKSISPRDFRDAFFTTWENSTIRITHSGAGIEYIGIDRKDVKSKIFLGKKDLNGSNIMSSVLLSSDVDIFFYNTKTDSESHNFKAAFLGGDDSSLWKNSPYLEVDKVGKSLVLRLINKNGDIILKSSDRIDLNGIKIPSESNISDMVLDPQFNDGDLYLTLDSKYHLNLRKMNKLDNDFLFSNSDPTILDVGGIKSGMTFDSVPISEVIRQILYPYLPTLVKINIPSVIERDHTNNINIDFEYDVIRRSNDVKSIQIVVENTKTSILTKNGPEIKSSGMKVEKIKDSISISPKKIINDKVLGDFKIKITAYDGQESSFGESSFNFVYPYFYGILDDEVDYIPKLNKIIDVRNNQKMVVVGDGYIYFMYPSYYGNLSNIVDVDGVSIYDKFDFSIVENVVSPEGKWSDVDFNLYKSQDKIDSSFPLTYRIIFD